MLLPESILHEIDYYSVENHKQYNEYTDVVNIFFRKRIERVPFLFFWLRYKIVQREPLQFKFRRRVTDSDRPGFIISHKNEEFLELTEQLENFIKQNHQ